MRLIDTVNQALRLIPTWPVYVLCALPAPWLFYLGATGGLGVEPIKELEHQLGALALKFLVAGLAVTPLRRFVGINLMKFRRAIGLITFYYVVCHLLVWLFLDVQFLSEVWADILKRPYITVGMLAFVLLVPLALTSNGWSVRKLGPKWRRLHALVYAAAILAALHFTMLVKGFQIEPLAYFGAILFLLITRLPKRRKKQAV